MCSGPLLATRCIPVSFGGTRFHTSYFDQSLWTRGTHRAQFANESLCRSISSVEGHVAGLSCTPLNLGVRGPWADSSRSFPIFKEYSPARLTWRITARTTHCAV